MKILHLHSREAMKTLREGRTLAEGESPEAMVARVLDAVLGVETVFGTPRFEIDVFRVKVEEVLTRGLAILGTPLLTNAGRKNAALSSCIAVPIDTKRPLKSSLPIIEAHYGQNMGSGYNLDDQPDPVAAVEQLNDHAARVQDAGGCERPIALMAHVDIDHPKVFEFASMKSTRNDIVHLNLSINTSSEFMQALEAGSPYQLRDGSTIEARALWQAIVEAACKCGDPGLLFLERFRADDPTPTLSTYSTTAPCAEVGLAPGEACVFGYVNVAAFFGRSGGDRFDFEGLGQTAATLTRVLDDALEVSLAAYPHQKSRIVMGGKRKIGIGVVGYADLLVRLGLSYGSERAVNLLQDILLTIALRSKRASVELSSSRGPFPAFPTSRLAGRDFLVSKYGSLESSVVSAADWREIDRLIQSRGIRNASTTALPPSGRTAILLGSSPSIEPWFSLLGSDGNAKPLVLAALDRAGVSPELRHAVLAVVRATGTSQKIQELPADLRMTLRRAVEIPASEHVLVSAVATRCVDEGVSKTINLPGTATHDTVSSAFLQAWRSGMKAISVYRDGSRVNQPEALSG